MLERVSATIVPGVLSCASIFLGLAAWLVLAADLARAHFVADLPPAFLVGLYAAGFLLGCISLALCYSLRRGPRSVGRLALIGIAINVSVPVLLPVVGIFLLMFGPLFGFGAVNG